MKKSKKELKKAYRLFDCRFIEEDFKYINKKLIKLKKEYGISKSLILLELFKSYDKDIKNKNI